MDRDRWYRMLEVAARAMCDPGASPWRQLPPGDGLCQTSEPYGCCGCGATLPYREPDRSEPGWWERMVPGIDEGEHEEACLWKALRALDAPDGEGE